MKQLGLSHIQYCDDSDGYFTRYTYTNTNKKVCSWLYGLAKGKYLNDNNTMRCPSFTLAQAMPLLDETHIETTSADTYLNYPHYGCNIRTKFGQTGGADNNSQVLQPSTTYMMIECSYAQHGTNNQRGFYSATNPFSNASPGKMAGCIHARHSGIVTTLYFDGHVSGINVGVTGPVQEYTDSYNSYTKLPTYTNPSVGPDFWYTHKM